MIYMIMCPENLVDVSSLNNLANLTDAFFVFGGHSLGKARRIRQEEERHWGVIG